ncbi:hypothetical protein PGIGA_G00074640 [Pangasianodon gigas]|uniref:Uncharacterized protein n=1 Tax=Pangasianodon gigas TaxID=30993 RepID=A0ACC5X8L3_PANGG|nr:hypothetical protein [Pangasianodon gigas]
MEFPSGYGKMVVSVTLKSDAKYSDSEVLAWLNHTLQSGFNTVEQTCSGAAYCQLMDLLNPGCIDLRNVKFKVEDEIDMTNNYKLLEGAFVKTSINKTLEIEKLVSGNITETLNLLRWFKVFFEHNFAGHSYNPVVARGGQILEPHVPKKPRALVQLDFSVPDRLSENADTKVERNVPESFYSSRAVLCFIRKYCPSVLASTDSSITCSKAKQVLGQKYPKDIVAVCNQAPYCLYMYHEGEKAYVVLIGYFDQAAGETRVRLLDIIEEMHTTLLNCVVETLKKFEIPLANLAAFYSNAPNLTELISGLKALNSGTVFLCSLTSVAEQACHSGITAMELSAQIQELIKEVHQNFSSLPDFLKEQLNNVEEFNLTPSLISDCLSLRTTIYKMATAWSDLVQYFNFQSASSNSNRQICCLLNDKALRLSFLFLSHALQPLCKFQESLDCGKDVRTLLQDACSLVHVYISSFLTPKAVERFFRRGNLGSPMKDMMEHLPRDKVKVGEEVAEYLHQDDAELSGSLDLFYKSAVSFYTAVSSSIVKSLPMSHSALRNMDALLSPEGKLEVTGKAISDLGVQFGLCMCGEAFSLLTDEFLEYQFAEQEDILAGPAVQSLEQYWKAELRIMGKTSLFRKLILSLLALPKTLRMERVFAQVFESVDHCIDSSVEERKIDISDDKDMVHDDDDVTDACSYKSAPSHPLSPETQENSTSDVIDLTEVEDVIFMETNASASGPDTEMTKEDPDFSESIVIDDDDDDDDDDEDTDDDVIWTDTLYPEKTKDNISSTPNKEMEYSYQDGKPFAAGEMVWGQVESFALSPGLVHRWTEGKPRKHIRKVVWFGDGMVSKVHSDGLWPYAAFAQCFCPNSFAMVMTYKDAIFHSLQVAAERAGKVFCLNSDSKEDLLRLMLDWAFGGFKPSGPNGLRPRSREDECLKMFSWSVQKWNKIIVSETQKDQEKLEKLCNLKEVSVCLKRLSLDLQNGRLDLKDENVEEKLSYAKSKQSSLQNEKKFSLSASWPAPRKQKCVSKNKNQNKDQSSIVQGKQDYNRYQMAHEVFVKGKNIEDFCLSCGTAHIEIFHPLFEGSLCLKCKDNFTETLYRYDEDGYQSYCTVCCAGLEVILCGHDSCSRSYCVDCLDILIGKGTFNQLKDLDPWICYLCAPERSSGALRPRHDWSIRVQEFFANNSAMEFEPHRVYPSIPANQRCPIRVLSLFDGIGTGYLVLKDLGFKVERYVASEIDDESITVSMVNHDGKITQVDDVRGITRKHIEKWGPFDLLIGGSPCNDLSIVNPARKGLFEGTGRLFFEYYRLLNIMKPKEDDPRPFFWLFENVVFMNTRDKSDICRFLECNPVLVDAVKVSPAHRARYFWGNLPGMNRPIIASQNDKLTLQECLETGRTAKYVKVRTITTRTNSLKQGKNDQHFPVSMNGKDDSLWITELEKIFGFPKHYTDVKNMGRMQRQKLLGKSWSVPVIRHLFAPLKDYFACDEVPLK